MNGSVVGFDTREGALDYLSQYVGVFTGNGESREDGQIQSVVESGDWIAFSCIFSVPSDGEPRTVKPWIYEKGTMCVIGT